MAVPEYNIGEAPRLKDYEVTPKLLRRFWSKVNFFGPLIRPDLGCCWEWNASRNAYGYGQLGFALYRGGKWTSQPIIASRVSYWLANGEFDESLHVCHKCDNPPCVTPSHLFLGTPKDNIQDCVKKGRNHRVYSASQVVRYEALRDAGWGRDTALLRSGLPHSFNGQPNLSEVHREHMAPHAIHQINGHDFAARGLTRFEDAVSSAFRRLTKRQQVILSVRLGLDGHDEHTMEEVAERWGRTKQRVEQVESRAVKRLRELFFAEIR